MAHAASALCLTLIRKADLVQWRAYVPSGAKWNACERVELSDASGEALRKRIKQHSCDLLFVPGGSVAPGITIPTVPWVHDLMIFEHPEWFPQGWIKRRMTSSLFLRGIRQAPSVLAVSGHTKKMICRYTEISQAKVTVTGEGGDGWLSDRTEEEIRLIRERARMDCRSRWGIARPFVLCLGTVEPRKNIAMLIRAWKQSMPKHGSALVVAGSDGWKFRDVEEEMEKIPISLRKYYFRIRRISDAERLLLLTSATAVTVPSLGEGFGLVALEAMQAGTPLLSSNAGALPEVIGNGGIFLDPQNASAWAEQISRIILDADLQKMLSEQGRSQSKKWSWERAAEITLESLKKI